jgi:hypothetical protein
MSVNNIINFVGFQIVWFAAVLGAANAMPWTGVIAILIWLAVHLSVHRKQLIQEVGLIIFAALLGYSLDSILVLLNAIQFPEHAQLGYPSTLWMVALWINFATTIRHSLSWLNHRYFLMTFVGGVSGALAYWAGVQLGALLFNDTVIALFSIFSMWFFALPLLYVFSNRFFTFQKTHNHSVSLQGGTST